MLPLGVIMCVNPCVLTHAYPHKPLRKIEVTKLTAQFTCGLMSDLEICKHRCHYWDQMSLNNTKLETSFWCASQDFDPWCWTSTAQYSIAWDNCTQVLWIEQHNLWTVQNGVCIVVIERLLHTDQVFSVEQFVQLKTQSQSAMLLICS